MKKWIAFLCFFSTLCAQQTALEHSFLIAMDKDYHEGRENRMEGTVGLCQKKFLEVVHHPYRTYSLEKILNQMSMLKKKYAVDIKECLENAPYAESKRVRLGIEPRISLVDSEKYALTSLFLWGFAAEKESLEKHYIRQVYIEYAIKKQMLQKYLELQEKSPFFHRTFSQWASKHQNKFSQQEYLEILEKEKMAKIIKISQRSDDDHLEKFVKLPQQFATVMQMFNSFYVPLFFMQGDYVHFVPKNNTEQRALVIWEKYGVEFQTLLKQLDRWIEKHEKRLSIS